MARRPAVTLLGIMVVLVSAAVGVTWFACKRGPTEGELRAFVLGSTPDAIGVEVIRNDSDATGTIWFRVLKRDGGSSDEQGYEFADRWVWPWRSYFEADQ